MKPQKYNKDGFKPAAVPKDRFYTKTVTLNPKKAAEAWDNLSDSRILIRVSLGPVFVHNALAGMLNGKRKRQRN